MYRALTYPLLGKELIGVDYKVRSLAVLTGFVLFAGLIWAVLRPGIKSPDAGTMIFAVNWQPAFCESKPQKPECRSQVQDRFDANNFSLHGLWFQPSGTHYCGVDYKTEKIDRSGNWNLLPELELSPSLENELAMKMPGYQSALHRHEWVKHGTCMPGNTGPEVYFARSLQLLNAVNQSHLRTLFAHNKGRRITREHIASAWHADVTLPETEKITIGCQQDNGRQLIHELRFEIRSVTADFFVNDRERKTSTQVVGCRSGIVDKAGDQ